jgi:hypothetical protein
MRQLAIDPHAAPLEMVSGVGGSAVPAHFFNIEIDLQGAVRFPVYAGFTEGLESAGKGLLGQIGFFDRFNVQFRLSEKNCYIEVPDGTSKHP